MKQAVNLTTGLPSNDVKTLIEEAFAVNCVPRLTVDWNLNRYFSPSADNVLPEATNAANADIFPISSIVEPLRPTKGMPKAIVNQSTSSPGYKQAHEPRFYMADKDSKYKYWISPVTTNGSGVFPTNPDDSNTTVVKPYITYPQVVQANKIIIKLEDTWARPNVWRVKVQTENAGAWTTVATSPTIANDGTVTLYYNGSTWSSTKPAVPVLTNVKGIRLEVDSLTSGRKRDGSVMTYKTKGQTTTPASTNTTGANSYFSLIAIEAHREEDWTDRLVSLDTDMDAAEQSSLYPIGTLTTNGATLSLYNGDGFLNKENLASPYFGLLESNIEFNLEYIFESEGTEYSVQEFKMNGANWTSTDEPQISLRVEDDSKFLKTLPPRKIMIRNKSVLEIAWRLLDSVGYNNYVVDAGDRTDEHVIPVFFTDGSESVWEILDGLAKATQTAFYFDSFGKLQIKTRSAAFREEEPVWSFYGIDEAGRLADIKNVAGGEALGVNTFKVTYKPRSWKQTIYGSPMLDVVWKPENDEILRSSKLVKNFDAGHTDLWLTAAQAGIWPYKGTMWIDGEIVRYEGKQYVYYTHNESGGVYTPVVNTVIVKSQEEKDSYDLQSSNYFRNKNHMTGMLKVTERGAMETPVADHKVQPFAYNFSRFISTSRIRNKGSFVFNKTNSSMVITGEGSAIKATTAVYMAHRSMGKNMWNFGFRGRPVGSEKVQRGGMALYINNNGDGYYIDITPTNKLNKTARANRNEICIISRSGGKETIVAKGAKTLVDNRFRDYDITVVQGPGGNHRIYVYVNGRRVLNVKVPSGKKRNANGNWGFYARKQSKWEFEYVYTSDKDPSRLGTKDTDEKEEFSWYDLTTGGLRGGWWLKNFVTNSIDGPDPHKPNTKIHGYHFDEFNPYVHEIREYDVNFEPYPVAYAELYCSNPGAQVLGFKSDPVSAKFSIANVSRGNVTVEGEDTVTYAGSGSAVQQVMAVLGHTLNEGEDKTVERRNSESITIDGEVLSELQSEWIQTESAATEIADWVDTHWSRGVDEITLETFGNPLLEVTDLVSIKYPELNMDPVTHKYYVVSIKNNFSAGLSSTIMLRRAV